MAKISVLSALTAAIGILFLLPPEATYGQSFPGKGNRGDWSEALPYYNRGNRYLEQGRYADAVKDYQAAIEKYSSDPDFFTNQGIAYRKLNDYDNAEQAFKKATELNPDDWAPLSDLANVYLSQNRLKEAIVAFEATLKRNPPASEKTAIENDIADIKKILRMNGELPLDEPKSGPDSRQKVTAKHGSFISSRATASKVPSSKTASIKASARTISSGASGKPSDQPANTAASEKIPDQTTSSGTAGKTSSPAADSKRLNGTGWDYVYKIMPPIIAASYILYKTPLL